MQFRYGKRSKRNLVENMRRLINRCDRGTLNNRSGRRTGRIEIKFGLGCVKQKGHASDGLRRNVAVECLKVSSEHTVGHSL